MPEIQGHRRLSTQEVKAPRPEGHDELPSNTLKSTRSPSEAAERAWDPGVPLRPPGVDSPSGLVALAWLSCFPRRRASALPLRGGGSISISSSVRYLRSEGSQGNFKPLVVVSGKKLKTQSQK